MKTMGINYFLIQYIYKKDRISFSALSKFHISNLIHLNIFLLNYVKIFILFLQKIVESCRTIRHNSINFFLQNDSHLDIFYRYSFFEIFWIIQNPNKHRDSSSLKMPIQRSIQTIKTFKQKSSTSFKSISLIQLLEKATFILCSHSVNIHGIFRS